MIRGGSNGLRAHFTRATAPAHQHIDLPVAAFGADQPLAPIENGRFDAVPSSHLAGIGFDLMLATTRLAALRPRQRRRASFAARM
jgi:hypothetical protein